MVICHESFDNGGVLRPSTAKTRQYTTMRFHGGGEGNLPVCGVRVRLALTRSCIVRTYGSQNLTSSAESLVNDPKRRCGTINGKENQEQPSGGGP